MSAACIPWYISTKLDLFGFDERFGTLIVVTAPPIISEAALTDLFAQFEARLQRGGRYALIIDTAGVAKIPGASLRKRIADWEKAHVDDTRRCNVAVGVVVASNLVRGALTAIAWAVPDETPRLHVATREEAVEWCCTRLEGEGLALAPSLVDLRRRGAEASTTK